MMNLQVQIIVWLCEEGTYAFQLSDFGFSDPNDNPDNNFAGIYITSLPLAGVLSLVSTAAVATGGAGMGSGSQLQQERVVHQSFWWNGGYRGLNCRIRCCDSRPIY